ncbi:SMI1/KNR4 family protein [Kitasatospora sp. NPDC008115]|uniref:SMI1/KNR4 family protein n=1 Tax=Kitasatospora sp. NPDC008115 TaxID=3364022 RepID=UPI0036E7B44F
MTATDHDAPANGVPALTAGIAAWLTARTAWWPARPAADDAALDAFETRHGLTLPADLRAWWRLDAVPANPWLPGGFAPVPLPAALETHAAWLLVAEQEGPPAEGEARFHPALLPIADNGGGDGLVVDLRPGTGHGHVLLWDHETWRSDPPWWESVTAMLRDTARALESGTPALLGHAARGGPQRPCVAFVDADRQVGWEPDREPAAP